MSNNIVPLNAGRMPAAFAGAVTPDMNKAMAEGLQAGFAVVSYRGKVWRIKHGGEDQALKNERREPIGTFPVIIVGVSPNISKQWYEKRFAEGDAEAPDCWSLDGVAPDESAPKRQCASCAACPQNQFGSRITEAGKKAKACQDSRRIAVVPYSDPENDTFGGPMMLRVPPMSLPNLARYGQELARVGAQPYAVGTNLSFNWDVAYPQLTFSPIGWLDDDTASRVVPILSDPQIDRMLTQTPPVAQEDDRPEQVASTLQGGKPSEQFTPRANPASQVAAKPEPEAKVETPAPASPTPAPETVAGPKKGAAAFKSPATPEAKAQAQPEARKEPVTTVVQQAPDDLQSAIDNLLGED